MNVQEFIQNIEREFDSLKPGTLKPESDFRKDFQWNSVNALIMIALITTEYGVTLNSEDIRKSITLQDLYNIVQSRM